MNTAGALPPKLHAALATTLGTEIGSATRLSGGMVNQAARVETSDGAVFLKWNEAAPPDLFASEAHGLNALRDTRTLRVPEVLAVADDPAFLALELIEPRAPTDAARFARRFGEALAALHRQAAPCEKFGLPRDNYLGTLPQINTPHARWPDFYRECRLLPQIALARDKGRLPPSRERSLMQVVEKLEALLEGLPSRPALLHGDLWSGNFLAAGEEPVVIDPAIYFGEREMEIAFVELFSGFPAGFVNAYNEAYPLEPGYQRRRPLHQLYPLLVHLNYFGEEYGPRLERACRVLVEP